MSRAGPEPPSAQSPFARLGRYRQREDVNIPSTGITRPSSLLRTHAPVPIPHDCLGLQALCSRSLQVVVSPCWDEHLPDVISVIRVASPGPLPRGVPAVLTRFFPQDSGLAIGTSSLAHRTISAKQLPQRRNFGAAVIHSCSGLSVCSPAWSLPPQG